ncbi:MAG: ribosomal protein [Phycisphaerales bacterium]|jgi:large subunit ribosomal protein L29|nr:ribosomal protein [Phycisphaerales bacterium]
MKAKLKELRDKKIEDLKRDVVEKQKHLFDLRSQAVTEKLEDPTQIGKTRKEIARINTILRERQTAEGKTAAAAATK